MFLTASLKEKENEKRQLCNYATLHFKQLVFHWLTNLSKILSGAPFMTRIWPEGLSSASWIESWKTEKGNEKVTTFTWQDLFWNKMCLFYWRESCRQTLNNECRVCASNRCLGDGVIFFSNGLNKSLIEADWMHIVSHMYSLCWRSVHSHMAMYSCGATTCIPPHKYAHVPTGTHSYTLSEVIYIWVTAYLISENQSKIAFFPPPLLSTQTLLFQGTGAQNTCRKSFVCFTTTVV